MLSQGLEIMFIGVGVVFCFLVTLICAVKTSSAIILKYFPEKKLPANQPRPSTDDRSKIAAAIAVALSQKSSKSLQYINVR